MTSDWKECKLEDVADFVYEKIEVNNLNVETYISTENMLPNKAGIVKATTLPSINLTSAFDVGDILVSNIRPYFKKNWQATFNGGCSNDVLVFRAKENICPKFLYYVLSDDKFFNYAMSTSKGTKMPRGDKQSIMLYKVPNFDLETQRKIAKVLCAIDDKIELNNKINKNLEQQIETLYNNNFNNSNKIVNISDLIDVRDGTHDSPKPQMSGRKLITSKHLLKYGVDKTSANLISEIDYKKINERSQVTTNDILISMIGTVGIVSFVIENPVDFCVKNVGIFRTSQTQELKYYIHCFLNSSKTQNYIHSHLAGTTQKYISLAELRTLKIQETSKDELKIFNKLVEPIYNKLINNVQENKNLTQLRDTLLPKLMSGEIDVSKVNIENI